MYTEPDIPQKTHRDNDENNKGRTDKQVNDWRLWIKRFLGKARLKNVTLTTTVGAAGPGAALPATPVGYVTWEINGILYKVPYYNI